MTRRFVADSEITTCERLRCLVAMQVGSMSGPTARFPAVAIDWRGIKHRGLNCMPVNRAYIATLTTVIKVLAELIVVAL